MNKGWLSPETTADRHQGGEESGLQGLGCSVESCSSPWENPLNQLCLSFVPEVFSRKPSQTTQVLLVTQP